MEIKSGRRILRIAGAPGQTFVEKSPQMVFLSAVGNCICAVVLSGVATDGDQSDSREAAGGWNGDDVRVVGRRLW